jgi:RNA polymerase sigma-70 factor (ECF subfamily)
MTIALRYARDDMDAADIMSHAFVKIFRSLHSFDRSKGNFHGWVKQIIIHEGLDHIKQRSRFMNKELTEAVEPVIENTAMEKLNADSIMNLIKMLPPATHAVFILYVVEGYTHPQIGEALNISQGTSKWHLSEARKILQQKLINYKQD